MPRVARQTRGAWLDGPLLRWIEWHWERGSRVVSELGGAWKRWPGCLMNALPYITDAVKVALPRALIGSIVVWRPSQRRR